MFKENGLKKFLTILFILFFSISLFAKASVKTFKVGTETFVEIEDYRTVKSFNIRHIKMITSYPNGIVIFLDRNYMNDVREQWTFQIDYDEFIKILENTK